MTPPNGTRFASKVAAPLSMAAIAIAVVAPATASASPGNGLTDHPVAVMASDGDQWDGGEPTGGTGIDAGPAAPPDTQSGPRLEDGGEPAGGIG